MTHENIFVTIYEVYESVLLCAVVEIGFEQTVYTVEEGSGPATVSVAVLSGQLSSDVVVRLDTTQRSAEGM